MLALPEMRSALHIVGRAVAFAAVCFATVQARADDVPISEDARAHFATGVALLQDPKAPRYEEAYREFKAAYAASPSYKILGNLALCAMKIERDGEAIQAYELYLKQGGFELPAAEREQIERDLLTLKMGVTQVVLSSDPPGAMILDARVPVQGEEIRNSYGVVLTNMSLALRRGHHVIRAHLAGYVDQDWEFDATGDAMGPHVFQMTKPAPPPALDRATVRSRPMPVAAYVAGAATVALAIGGGVVGVFAIQKRNDFNSLNDGDKYQAPSALNARSDGQTLNVVSDVLFGAAAVGLGVTLYLALTRPSVEQTTPPVAEGAPAARRNGVVEGEGAGADANKANKANEANRRMVTRMVRWVLVPTVGSRGAGAGFVASGSF